MIAGFGCGSPSSGIGFAVGDDLVVTAAHVVAGRADALTVTLVSGERLDVELIAFDPTVDVAIVRTAGLSTALNFADEASTDTWLATRSEEGRFQLGRVDSELVSVDWNGVFGDIDASYDGHRLSESVARGASGSPLIDGSGRVLGMVHSRRNTDGTETFAIGAAAIEAVLTDARTATQNTTTSGSRCLDDESP